MADTVFIGLDNVQSVANRLQPNIISGPAYYQRADLDRLGIKVVTGVQYKDTQVVLAVKGGTTRRKKVGECQESEMGYFIERELVAHICIMRKRYNEDRFQEKPGNIKINGSADVNFPAVEQFIDKLGETFASDVYANLFNGDEESDDVQMNFYNGYNTIINKDIEAGVISKANGNLITTGAFDAPQSEGDSAAYDEFVKWYLQWSAPLKRAKVNVYMPTDIALAIADAYEQKHRSHQAPVYQDNGNFKLPRHPKLTFIPTDDFGKGTRIFACIEGNLEFGINTESDSAFVSVERDASCDNKDLAIQIQMIAGCRIVNPLASAFVTNGGVVEDGYAVGDYVKDSVTVVSSNTDAGTVAIDNGGTAVESGEEVAKGTTLTLTATPKTGYKFVKWSNGSTQNPTSIVTTGFPIGIVGIFAKE
jgi:ribosomal protein L27